MAQALARIYGEAIDELPSDLFIPPEALEVFLDAFEGPLDLLLYLIKKHSLDILDIPMAALTRQYLSYIEQVKNELAADYLLMAAVLTEIKSRMLLPKPAAIDEEEDPRAALVARLIEYETFKQAAKNLDELGQVGRDFQAASAFFDRVEHLLLPQVDADDLRAAWLGLISRAKMNRHHKIGREELSVREHMARILKTLSGREHVEFESLFDPSGGLAQLIVTFLAMLELAKECLIAIVQREPFAPIYLKACHDSSES